MITDALTPDVVLASGSRFRAAMLEAAGVAVTVDPPAVDEDAVKSAMRETGSSAAETAEALAALKAQQAGSRHPGALVIGADQMLECGAAWFDKPADVAQARREAHQAALLEILDDEQEEIWILHGALRAHFARHAASRAGQSGDSGDRGGRGGHQSLRG